MKNRDVKFIIYQVLYIFVICVIALKGADINLEEVIDKRTVVQKTFADSLKRYIDSLLALGLVPKIEFDTAIKIQDLEDLQKRLAEMQQLKLEVQNMVRLEPGFTVVRESEIKKQQELKKELPPENKDKTDVVGKVVALSLFQYTENTVNNPYSLPLEVLADGNVLARIPSKSSGSFTLHGESTITFRVGDASDSKPIKRRRTPAIIFQSYSPGGPEASLRQLQATVGYTVRIDDDFPSTLDVKITGPVVVKPKDNFTYEVMLKFRNSKDEFDRWAEGKDAPYSVNFTVEVKNRISGQSVKQIKPFTFGDW
ncbi:hypothetical protein D4R20_01720 [bacterium]|nr:MAG: hypothetical protein D4R20_01720 [bacterium]